MSPTSPPSRYHTPWVLLGSAGVALCVTLMLFERDAPFAHALGWFSFVLLLSVCLGLLARLSWTRSVPIAARYVLFFSMVALLMGSWANWRWSERVAQQIPEKWNTEIQMVDVRIDSMPTRTDYGWRMLISPESSSYPEHMSLSWAEEDLPTAITQIRVGQVWRLPLHIRPPHASKNAGVFDQARHWLSQNITGLAYVRVYKKSTIAQLPRLLATHHDALSLLDNARFDAVKSMDAVLAQDTRPQWRASAQLLKALALGEQSGVSSAQWQLFQDTGVTHLVSISGLHVTALAGIVAWIAQWLWRRNASLTARIPARHVAQWVGLLGALTYALIAGWGLPAQRTVLMLALWLFLARLGVARSGLRVLGFSLWMVLLFDPFAVLTVGFWLSFGAVAWLIVAFDKVEEDKPVALPLHSGSWLSQVLRAAIGLTAAQLGIGMALLPMTLYFFHQASLIGVLVNFIAIPVMTLLLVPLLLSVLILFISGWGAPVLWINSVLMQILSGLTWVQMWARQTEWVGRIQWWQVLLLFALSIGVVVLVRHWWYGHKATKKLGVQLSSALLIMIAVLLWPPPYPQIPLGQLRVTIFDVGQGSAVLLQSHKQNWLYDAGPQQGRDSDAGMRIIVPHLRYLGVRQLDALILSHNDNDHTGGARSIAQTMPVHQIITSLNEEQLHTLGLAHIAHNACVAGQTGQFDGVEFLVLSPNQVVLQDQNIGDNDKSCVLRFATTLPAQNTHNSLSSILLTGDMTMWSEAKLVVNPAGGYYTHSTYRDTPLQSDIVLMPHHGSDSSSSAPLIAVTRPKWAVAQSGKYHQFKHPRPEVVARYLSAGTQVWRTDEQYSRVFILGE